MKSDLNLLDVSLRDGGHRTHFNFTDTVLKQLLKWLDQAGVEYIEIGYRNGFKNSVTPIGPAGLCNDDYLSFCRNIIKKSGIAVMIHPLNITIEDIKALKQNKVDLLRICVFKGEAADAVPIIQMARETGLKVSVNLTHISQYTIKELQSVLDHLKGYHPDIVYFADSNGNLLPEQVRKLYQTFLPHYSFSFGFHAHDNLGLAQANTIAALESGVKYIDASLSGMGKGMGNLKIEFFTAYLYALHQQSYQLNSLLMASNYVREHLKIGHEMIELDEFIRGIADLSTSELKKIKQNANYQKFLLNQRSI